MGEDVYFSLRRYYPTFDVRYPGRLSRQPLLQQMRLSRPLMARFRDLHDDNHGEFSCDEFLLGSWYSMGVTLIVGGRLCIELMPT